MSNPFSLQGKVALVTGDLSAHIGWQQLKRGVWEINSVDMDLDVIRTGTGKVFVDDEDEFENHRVSMNYPQDLQDELREQTTELLKHVAANQAPFDKAYRAQWIVKAQNLDTK